MKSMSTIKVKSGKVSKLSRAERIAKRIRTSQSKEKIGRLAENRAENRKRPIVLVLSSEQIPQAQFWTAPRRHYTVPNNLES